MPYVPYATEETTLSKLFGSVQDLADPESGISDLINLGSSALNFVEVITRFLPR